MLHSKDMEWQIKLKKKKKEEKELTTYCLTRDTRYGKGHT